MMKKTIIMLFVLFIVSGCSKEFQNKTAETTIGTYAESFDDVSRFSHVYEMWKNNIDTVYIQAGIDDFTDTYLLYTMPQSYSTIIKSLNKYNMKAYALLDNDVWLTNEEDVLDKEIKRILNYNTNFKSEKFEGIHIKPNLQATSHEELEAFYRNLKEASLEIKGHNESTGENLVLSINIDNEFLENDAFLSILKVVDKIVYENKADNIVEVEKILSIMDENNKKVVVIVDSNEDFFENNYVSLLRDLSEKLNHYGKYESFNGFIVSDYNEYKDFLKTKRP